ncbi:hypothetical protein BGZ63DRAFT_437836 [Mariannaea sp. PMI_226]|nr:hypothetical protein BGZ63DRAFT_437836 [Mariannaea sp. PMI_226]
MHKVASLDAWCPKLPSSNNAMGGLDGRYRHATRDFARIDGGTGQTRHVLVFTWERNVYLPHEPGGKKMKKKKKRKILSLRRGGAFCCTALSEQMDVHSNAKQHAYGKALPRFTDQNKLLCEVSPYQNFAGIFFSDVSTPRPSAYFVAEGEKKDKGVAVEYSPSLNNHPALGDSRENSEQADGCRAKPGDGLLREAIGRLYGV